MQLLIVVLLVAMTGVAAYLAGERAGGKRSDRSLVESRALVEELQSDCDGVRQDLGQSQAEVRSLLDQYASYSSELRTYLNTEVSLLTQERTAAINELAQVTVELSAALSQVRMLAGLMRRGPAVGTNPAGSPDAHPDAAGDALGGTPASATSEGSTTTTPGPAPDTPRQGQREGGPGAGGFSQVIWPSRMPVDLVTDSEVAVVEVHVAYLADMSGQYVTVLGMRRSTSMVAGRHVEEESTAGGDIEGFVSEYAADKLVGKAWPVVTDGWTVTDPGRFSAMSTGVGELNTFVHDMVLGRPAKAVADALGLPDVVADPVTELTLPGDRLLGSAVRWLRMTGIVVGVATGHPVLAIACVKAEARSRLTTVVADALDEAIRFPNARPPRRDDPPDVHGVDVPGPDRTPPRPPRRSRPVRRDPTVPSDPSSRRGPTLQPDPRRRPDPRVTPPPDNLPGRYPHVPSDPPREPGVPPRTRDDNGPRGPWDGGAPGF